MSDINVNFTVRLRWWVRPALWLSSWLMHLVKLAGIVITVGLIACHTTPPQPAPTRDADGAMLATPTSACDALARNGCMEGLSDHCVLALTHVVDSGLERFDLGCISAATSKDAVRSCTGMTGGCL